MRRLLITGLLSLWLIIPLPTVAANSCGSITIADTQTPSSSFLARVDELILTHGYGCKVRLIKSNIHLVINRMIQTGQPDIAPEVWLGPAIQKAIQIAQREHQLFPIIESIIGGGEEGFWVPAYLVKDNNSLATLAGIKAHADLFRNPETPSRSLVYGCRPGWECQDTVNYLYKALKLQAAGFDLFNPGTPESADQAIEQSYKKELPWFGYYHSPSTITARFRMVKVGVDATSLPDKNIEACINQSQCSEKQKNLYAEPKIQTVISQSFAYRAVSPHNYLRQRQLTRQQLNMILVWMHEKKATADEAARYFLLEHEKVWRPWLSLYETGKVRRALRPR